MIRTVFSVVLNKRIPSAKPAIICLFAFGVAFSGAVNNAMAQSVSPALKPVVATPEQKAAKHKRAVETALRRIETQLPLRSVDETALKKAAVERKVSTLRVCGDPGNMPLSNIDREGFQNKIIELVAKEMGARVSYFWRPYLERGLTRQTFDSEDCQVLLDVPSDFADAQTTEPIYRTTYVFAYRNDSGINIKGLDDPVLKKLKLGVYQTSGLRMALAKHGVRSNVSLHVLSHDADLRPENQPWQQVQKVIDGKLDVAGVWGPIAGWLVAMKNQPITLQPVNLMEDEVPLEFSLSIGLRRVDVVLKYKIELALEARKAEIEAILREYGVPLVECSKCFVAGDLPAHGLYVKPRHVYDEDADRSKMAEDQKVTREKLEAWLSAGADLNVELANAVLASDTERIRFLLEKGADINAFDNQGYAPLHSATRSRDGKIVALLLELGADPNLPDADGYTPLLHAVLRDHAPTIESLVGNGADIKARAKPMGDATVLAIAIVEHNLVAAMTLISHGAPVNAPSGALGLTPLMLAAGKETRHLTLGAGVRRIKKWDPKYPRTLAVVRALLTKGADVNLQNTQGVTALMLASAHNSTPVVGLLMQSGADINLVSKAGETASSIAMNNGNDAVANLIRLIAQSAKRNHNPVIQ